MNIVPIILAAGESKRMGKPKQTIIINEKPMIMHVIDMLQSIGFSTIYTVLGGNRDVIAPILNTFTSIILNDKWTTGLSSSIVKGIETIQSDASVDGVLVVLADQPFINADDIRKMLQMLESNPLKCIASSYKNKPGVPALFPRKYFKQLLTIRGDKGAKNMLLELKDETILYQHNSKLQDFDTPEDVKDYIS